MLILLYFITPFLLHIAYISVNSWSSSNVSCIVCLDLDLDLDLEHKCVDLSDYNRYMNQIWYKAQALHY